MLNISHSMFARCCNCGLLDVGKFLGRYYEHWVNMLSDIKPDEVVAQFYQLIVPQLHQILWPWHCDQQTCKTCNQMKASFLYGVFGHVTWLHPCVINQYQQAKKTQTFFDPRWSCPLSAILILCCILTYFSLSHYRLYRYIEQMEQEIEE